MADLQINFSKQSDKRRLHSILTTYEGPYRVYTQKIFKPDLWGQYYWLKMIPRLCRVTGYGTPQDMDFEVRKKFASYQRSVKPGKVEVVVLASLFFLEPAELIFKLDMIREWANSTLNADIEPMPRYD